MHKLCSLPKCFLRFQRVAKTSPHVSHIQHKLYLNCRKCAKRWELNKPWFLCLIIHGLVWGAFRFSRMKNPFVHVSHWVDQSFFHHVFILGPFKIPKCWKIVFTHFTLMKIFSSSTSYTEIVESVLNLQLIKDDENLTKIDQIHLLGTHTFPP